MAEKEDKIVLEREYVVPLRKKFIKTQKYKRAEKAIKALKEFIARHMKIYDRDLKKVKIDKYVNEEIWQRSIKKPPAKIKVKAKKFESGIVKVELAEIPEFLKWRIEREKRLAEKPAKKEEKVKEEEKKVEEVKEEKPEEEKKEEIEKEKSTVEAGVKEQGKRAKETKHETKMKTGPKRQFRMALQK